MTEEDANTEVIVRTQVKDDQRGRLNSARELDRTGLVCVRRRSRRNSMFALA